MSIELDVLDVSPVLKAARDKRAKLQTKLDELLKAPTDEKRDLNDPEAAKFEELSSEIDKADKRLKTLEKDGQRRAAAARAAAGDPADHGKRLPARDGVVRHEPGIYRRDASTRFGEPSYVRDLAAFSLGGAYSTGIPAEDARARLMQNWKEIERDAEQGEEKRMASRIVDEVRRWGAVPDMEARVNPNTTAGTGGEFVPPLWLVSSYVPFMRFGRICANRCNNNPLPPGIDVINIPKITTGSLTAIQAANAAAVASRDIVTATVSGSVRTIAGQEDISLQLLEQSPLAMDGVIFQDASNDYDLQLDTQILTGTGSNGQHQGVLTQAGSTSNTSITQINLVTCASTVWADASTTGTQLRSIANGINQIETLRVAPATGIWVHPRRANNWMVTAFDTTGRPMFVPYGAWNAFGLNQPDVPQGVCGEVLGLPVVKDGNMPTTCVTSAVTGGTGDAIAVVKEDDLYLYEGTLRMRALPEVLSGTLQIRFQVYAYSAFIPSRFPPSVSLVTGTTGLAAPTF